MFSYMSLMAAKGWLDPMFAGLFSLIMLIALRDIVWKAIALWKAGRSNQLAWFICLFIFNTAGILPILYLLFFQKKDKALVKVIEKKPEPIKVIAKRIAVKKVVTKKPVAKKVVKKTK